MHSLTDSVFRLNELRNITDESELKAKAQEIDQKINRELADTFAELLEPAAKRKLQQQIARLLQDAVESNPNADEKADEQACLEIVQQRADLMREYRRQHRRGVWNKHRSLLKPFQETLSGLKALVREILAGSARMQEIRQHILDLHFKKKHAKKVDRLVLSEAQLEKRQQMYDEIEAPTESECADVTDARGSGCFLSTLSRRECVLDAEPLWICGRVDRSGGAQVHNSELIKIEYVSADLVSDSYFRMAVEAAAGGSVDIHGGGKNAQNQNANVDFYDSSRQRVNCRLFPIYCNAAHFRVSKPYFDEATAHTLSGRVDMRAADYNLPSAIIGDMISRQRLSEFNVRRLLHEVVPSMRIFLDNHMTVPFDLRSYNREADRSKPKEPLANRRRCRLVKYIETFKARTSAWVTTAGVLFADRLLNLDLKVDHEFYLSLLFQRMRGMFHIYSCQERNTTDKIYKQILRVLICGFGDPANAEEKESQDDVGLVVDGRMPGDWGRAIAVPDGLDETPLTRKEYDQFDVSVMKPSTKQMIATVVSRLDIRDMLQSMAFFDVLEKLGPDAFDAKAYNEDAFRAFSTHRFANRERTPNDVNVLWREIGCPDDVDQVQVLRAMCAVSLLFHGNRVYQENIDWFADDGQKQLFYDPQSVLSHIHGQFLQKQIHQDK